MKLPKAGATYTQERLGIAAVQIYAARSKQIWRETDTGDVGIDGQLEFVNAEGFATGRMVAVQVKSGPSFFKHEADTGWKFYPEDKHRYYWESFPLPVILILHNPDNEESYWVDVRQALRMPKEQQAFVELPSENRLEATEPTTLFENAGALDIAFIPEIADVFRVLLEIRSAERSFPLSYFDLFVHGLTNICRTIYYGTDVIMNAVEYNLSVLDSDIGMGMGATEQQFTFDFVKFLLAQNLAQIDYSDCLIDWVDREMQPHFVAPLTSRGRELVAFIHEEERRLVEDGQMENEGALHVAQEAFFEMVPMSYFSRFPRIKAFQDQYEKDFGL